MLYQFLDWRLGRHGFRRLYTLEIEKVHEKFGKKALPNKLGNWEDFQNFAGASGIALPEEHEAAKAVFPGNNDYPTLDWLAAEYDKMLIYVTQENPTLAKEMGLKVEKDAQPPQAHPPNPVTPEKPFTPAPPPQPAGKDKDKDKDDEHHKRK